MRGQNCVYPSIKNLRSKEIDISNVIVNLTTNRAEIRGKEMEEISFSAPTNRHVFGDFLF